MSADYLDFNGGSAGVAGSASDRWSGFGGSDYAYDYSDGFGEITVGKLQRFIIYIYLKFLIVLNWIKMRFLNLLTLIFIDILYSFLAKI